MDIYFTDLTKDAQMRYLESEGFDVCFMGHFDYQMLDEEPIAKTWG